MFFLFEERSMCGAVVGRGPSGENMQLSANMCTHFGVIFPPVKGKSSASQQEIKRGFCQKITAKNAGGRKPPSFFLAG